MDSASGKKKAVKVKQYKLFLKSIHLSLEGLFMQLK